MYIYMKKKEGFFILSKYLFSVLNSNMTSLAPRLDVTFEKARKPR